MQIRSVEELEALLGPTSEAVADIRRLFDLAEGYGFKEWLVFDPSVVRGLAYYTGMQPWSCIAQGNVYMRQGQGLSHESSCASGRIC